MGFLDGVFPKGIHIQNTIISAHIKHVLYTRVDALVSFPSKWKKNQLVKMKNYSISGFWKETLKDTVGTVILFGAWNEQKRELNPFLENISIFKSCP